MGAEKTGKTKFALSAFDFPGIDPKQILYLDNHGSTKSFDVHQWSEQEPWGVRYIDPLDPTELYTIVLEVRNEIKTKKRKYFLIAVDDWSEFAQGDIDDRLDGADESQVPGHWRKHGDMLRSAARLLSPLVTGAHHLAIFQAALLADPLVPRPVKVQDGKSKYVADTREVKIRPFLQGAFAAWMPYKLDALFYTTFSAKGGGIYKFEMEFMPHGLVDVYSRWMHLWVNDPKLPKTMLNPTLERVLALIGNVTEATEGETNG